MKKIWYTKTSWDNGWPLFLVWDDELWLEYIIRLAGNPILLLEYAYKVYWWEDFMKVYKSLKDKAIDDITISNLKALGEAKAYCENFVKIIQAMEQAKKSMFVIYKN